MITKFQLIRNIGIFDSVDTGARLLLNRFALIYAENGRGKTTLAEILRSLGSNNPLPILERHRLGAKGPPHVVIVDDTDKESVFENGIWSNYFSSITVFDDHFVTENICSGMEVEITHRKKLHELIIGEQGVKLNTDLQGHIDRIEQHNRDLKIKKDRIPHNILHSLTVDAFCELKEQPDIDALITEAERALAAAHQADAVRQAPSFEPISLPPINLSDIEVVLSTQLQNLEERTVGLVQKHLKKIGDAGEAWVGDGMLRIKGASNNSDKGTCPFCAQDLSGSPIITHYRAYFSGVYAELKSHIDTAIGNVESVHTGKALAIFERSIRHAERSREFWKTFVNVPDISINTEEISLAWNEAIQGILRDLRTKQSAPLDPVSIDDSIREKVRAFDQFRREIERLSADLLQTGQQIDRAKAEVAAADVAVLTTRLGKLKATKERFLPQVIVLCGAYLQEISDKIATEHRRQTAREALDQYREHIFTNYETAINEYLEKFNVGFQLGSVKAGNRGKSSTCNYNVLINDKAVELAPREGEQSFKNTLSAGDRNALALAFFLACLELDPNHNQKIVVVDDPMTSLDEHRQGTTIHEIRRLSGNVAQLIIFSHSKQFLCGLWEGADTNLRSACQISRANDGSKLTEWNVSQDCITEHDRRHALVRSYIDGSASSNKREVASALRLILESFVRVAYPESFCPGDSLGEFIHHCKREEAILSCADISSLDGLLVYANKFHHDKNVGSQTAEINETELLHFARETLSFTKRA